MIAFVLMLALQAAPPPDPQCQLACGMELAACIGSCADGLDPEKPENKDKIEACTKSCSAKTQPCVQQCKRPKEGKKP